MTNTAFKNNIEFGFLLNALINAALTYSSKTFSIHTEREGADIFNMYVLNANLEVVETAIVKGKPSADFEFESLKTKYIFDYDNVLVSV